MIWDDRGGGGARIAKIAKIAGIAKIENHDGNQGFGIDGNIDEAGLVRSQSRAARIVLRSAAKAISAFSGD